MGHKYISLKTNQFNRKKYLTGFLIFMVLVIDIINKKPDDIAYILTCCYLPGLTYESEYGIGDKDYVSNYDVPEWFYEDEGIVSGNEDLAVADGNDSIINKDAVNISMENSDDTAGAKSEDSTAVIRNMSAGTTYTRKQLSEPDFLTGRIFTVDNNTSMNSDELSIDNLLDADMSLESLSGDNADDVSTDQMPFKVLIYHTHASESFADSRPGESEDTVVGVGAYLTKLLNEQYKIPTYHDETIYDVIDGQLDRSKAYENSFNGISKILADNPSIEVVIDLHRDGVDEETHLVTEVNGKPTAKIMFLNGVSRSNLNGDIEYLNNPNKLGNLAFSFQMYLAGKEQYGDYVRKIYVRSLRYNLHVMPRAALIEVGAQNNTIEEEMNAMEPLAAILDKVLRNSH